MAEMAMVVGAHPYCVTGLRWCVVDSQSRSKGNSIRCSYPLDVCLRLSCHLIDLDNSPLAVHAAHMQASRRKQKEEPSEQALGGYVAIAPILKGDVGIRRMMRNGAIAICLALLTSCATPQSTRCSIEWQAVMQTDACMPGGTLWSEHETGKDAYQSMYASILAFTQLPVKDVVPFLLGRMSSMSPTSVHICPYQCATEGELAVYILEVVTSKPWFKAIDLTDRPDNRQEAVRKALKNADMRMRLHNYYVMENSNKPLQNTSQ